jgi:hypothetical protein
VVTIEQNLFRAQDGGDVELFQERNGFIKKLGDVFKAFCHAVSVAHFTPARQGGANPAWVSPKQEERAIALEKPCADGIIPTRLI